MADNTIKIGGELESMATGKVVAAASAIKDKARNKTQEAINGDVEQAIAEQSAQFEALSEETSAAVASSSESAREAKQYLANLQEAITELPDGQTVSAQVAINQVDIAELKTNVVVDLSTRYSTSYANLSAALTALNNDATATNIKKTGVSIKFINSSTNKYEQWNLKASYWSTNTSDWTLDVDGSITNGKLKLPFELEKPSSNEYVTQASEIGYNNGNVKDALDNATDVLDSAVEILYNQVPLSDGSALTEEELSFVDEDGNCIEQLKDGHLKTKNFDSRNSATKAYADNAAATIAEAKVAEGLTDVVEAFNDEGDSETLSFVDEDSECVMQVKDGHLKTKNFDSRNVINEADLAGFVQEDNVDENDASVAIIDENNNCAMVIKNGHIKTKNFDSSNITPPTPPEVDTPEICLPDNIYAIVGDTLQIFFKSIINTANYKDYGIVAVCNIGKSYPRYYELTAYTNNIGYHSLQILIYGNDKIIKSKTVNLYVVDKATSQATPKNILVIGASTLTDGIVVGEANRRFSAITGDGTPANPTGLGITGINFIGRKSAADIHQDATGGYSWKIYATDALKMVRFNISGVSAVNIGARFSIEGVSISQTYYFTVIEVNIEEGSGNILCEVYGGYIYSSLPASGTLVKISGTADSTITYNSYLFEDGNPFWNTNAGKLDFLNYSTRYCNGASIDMIYTHLGLNGLSSKEAVDTTITNYVLPFIRQYHIDYPNGKFILGTLQLGSPNGGYGSVGYAHTYQNWYNLSSVFWYILEKYQEISKDAEFSSYVKISDCTAEFDCENGYPTTNKAVNNRVSETEVVQTNQIHPTSAGKKMISDSIYRTITAII